MKTLLFAAFFSMISLSAISQDRHKKPKATEDANVLDITKNKGTAISYETPAEMKARFEKEAELKLWDAETKAKELAKLPAGGWLHLGIVRESIGAANTEGFTIVVKDAAGNEVLRQQGKPGVASYFMVSGLTFWRNLDIIPVTQELKTGYTVYVIDEVFKKRYEYQIQNN